MGYFQTTHSQEQMLNSTKITNPAMIIRDGEDHQNYDGPGAFNTLSRESHRQPSKRALARSTSRQRHVERQDDSININIKNKASEKDEQHQVVSFNQTHAD